MIELRPFSHEDAPVLKELIYSNLTIPEINCLFQTGAPKSIVVVTLRCLG